MECPACYNIFDEKKRTPRNLNCGHTFCETCLLQLQHSKIYNCPICRKEQKGFKATSLPKNYIVMELLQKQTEAQKTASMCKVHPTEFLRFFCTTCSCLLCPECIVDHSGHQFIKHSESGIFCNNYLAYLFRGKVEELIVNTKETMDEATRKIGEISTAKKELKEYAKSQIALINNATEKMIKMIKDKQENIIKDFNGAISIEEKKLNVEEAKYQTIKSNLQEKDVYLGNLLEGLAETSKLPDEKEKNQGLDDRRVQIQLLYHKAHKGGIPIVHPPYFAIDSESLVNALDYFIRVHVSQEEYGVKKKICYFGETNHVLKFDLETETWEHIKLHESHDFCYYGAAVSTCQGEALIAGGGNSTSVVLYSEYESKYII